MEGLIFALFILALLVAAFFATQTIRRDLNERENLRSDLRRESLHVRPGSTSRGPRAPYGPAQAREQSEKAFTNRP